MVPSDFNSKGGRGQKIVTAKKVDHTRARFITGRGISEGREEWGLKKRKHKSGSKNESMYQCNEGREKNCFIRDGSR